MKKFLKKFNIYISILFILIFIIEFLTSYVFRKYSSFKIKSNPKCIIIGHSHTECAYNDSLIVDFKNIAQSGESYFYSYFKLKKILEQNPSIEKVYIEYTNNQIDKKMDDWIWDDVHISNRCSYYSPFMSFSDQLVLLKNNPQGFLNSFAFSNKTKISAILSRDLNFSNKIGGYLYLVRDKTDSLLKVSSDNKQENDSEIDNQSNTENISKVNLLYLEKIIVLVKSFNKKPILVRSPQHSKYEMFRNEALYKSIYKKRFHNIEYLDFSKFVLSNSEYGDLDHLNYKGAKKFSVFFNKFIQNENLSITNKQEFIDKYIESELNKNVIKKTPMLP